MGRYHHLSLEEREDIMVMSREGRSLGEIARALGRSGSTVSRELRRNSCRAGSPGAFYRASTAQRRYGERRLACRRPRKLDDPGLRSLVQARILEDRWSPEQVAGRLALEGGPRVSKDTIYRAIRRRDLDTPELARTARGLAGRLRHKGKRRLRRKDGEEERRGRVRAPHELAERPAEAAARSRLGDWEADTVVGKGSGPCLVTLVDRRSRFLTGGLAPAHRSAEVAEVEKAALSGGPALTVTPDRGKEFARCADVTAATGAEFYFCPPHSPWERGTNENTNGLVREYFPKGTDFSLVAPEEVGRVYDAINRRPRKCLGYRTPLEVHRSEALHLI